MNGTMAISGNNVLPVTKARGELGKLVDQTGRKKYFVLTKSGVPKAVIVSFDYLMNLQETVGKIYQRTYLDLKLLPYTREFSQEEIDEWLAEDKS